MTFDPSRDSLLHSLFCFPLLSFNLEGDRRTLVALVILTDSKRASGEGRTKKEKHRLSKDEHMEAPTGMQIFVSHRLLRIVSGPRDTECRLDSQTKH